LPVKHALALAFFVVLLGAGWLRPVEARDLPAGGMTADEIATWLRISNYPATVKPNTTQSNGQIVSSTVDGINFDIYLYDCTGARCRSIQYSAGWTSTTNLSDKILAWDKDKRYCRAYVGTNNALWCEYDIDVDPGGTFEMLDHSLVRWREVVNAFKQRVIPY
jgi:hypothetical protein